MLEIDFYLWPIYGDHIGTLWIQLFNFLLLLFLLNILIYKPIRGILAKRREAENVLKSAIEDFQTRSDQNEESIEEGRVQVRRQGATEKEGIKSSGREKEHGILQDAISKADEKLEKARKEIDAKIADVRQSLEDQITLFSNDLVEKILGRKI